MIDSLPYSNVCIHGPAALALAPDSEFDGIPAVLAREFEGFRGASSARGTIRRIHFLMQPVIGETSPEAYEIRIEPTQITVKSAGAAGLMFGGRTLLRLLEEGPLAPLVLTDAPTVAVRGAKVYLPAPTEEAIAEFKQFVDILSRCRYNMLMIELGGAMEYKSHPEINAGWIEYCRFMNEYSGKPDEIQHAFDWNKNSIHTTNGGGQVLSQERIAELAAYCRERGIEVVPEVPSLSHCDYLLTRHPELAERPEDPYPDTVCPNHPDYYPLLFDLLEEIIALFRPARINLGHDEYYSIGLCPRCAGKSAVDIYADDICRCHAFLEARNVKTVIWGEKLLKAAYLDGYPIGGSQVSVWHQPDSAVKTPPTWPAIDRMPSGLEVFHWYWFIDRNLEEAFVRRGIPMIFGNFRGDEMPDWQTRRRAPNLLGSCCSNWGASDLKTLQRNGILLELFYTSALQWNGTLTSEDYGRICRWAFAEAFFTHNQLAGAGRYLHLTHSTDEARRYITFCDGFFLDEAGDRLGDHVFGTADGGEFRVPVIYGGNITGRQYSAARGEVALYDMGAANSTSHPTDYYKIDRHLAEVSFRALPQELPQGTSVQFRVKLPDGVVVSEYRGFEPKAGVTAAVCLHGWFEVRQD